VTKFLLGLLAGAVATALVWVGTDSVLLAAVFGGIAFVVAWLVETALDRH
jgi:hypothetical protein